MISRTTSPQSLLAGLTLYFVALIAVVVTIALTKPDWLSVLPFGGMDALKVAEFFGNAQSLSDALTGAAPAFPPAQPASFTGAQIGLSAIFLTFSLAGTVLVMLPITWTYMVTRREIGYRKNFLRALLVLPICATAIVLLIHDSLALAFGLAAMVAAVRFRVTLDEAIDGIYVFAAVCVGLAAGVGHLGIAILMAIFFCFVNVILSIMNYGQNELDDARDMQRRAKLDLPADVG